MTDWDCADVPRWGPREWLIFQGLSIMMQKKAHKSYSWLYASLYLWCSVKSNTNRIKFHPSLVLPHFFFFLNLFIYFSYKASKPVHVATAVAGLTLRWKTKELVAGGVGGWGVGGGVGGVGGGWGVGWVGGWGVGGGWGWGVGGGGVGWVGGGGSVPPPATSGGNTLVYIWSCLTHMN